MTLNFRSLRLLIQGPPSLSWTRLVQVGGRGSLPESLAEVARQLAAERIFLYEVSPCHYPDPPPRP